MVAIMGARARLGIRKEHHEEFQAQKEADPVTAKAPAALRGTQGVLSARSGLVRGFLIAQELWVPTG